MIDSFLNFLGASGTQKQIDLGNLSVGMATLMLASVTLYISLRSTTRQNNHKIAEFRMKWIEEVRSLIVEHMTCCTDVSDSLLHSKDDSYFNFLKKAVEIELQLRLRLDPNDIIDRELMEKLLELRRVVAISRSAISTNDAEKRKSFFDQLNKTRMSCVQGSRIFLKKEWNRLKYEVHGRGLVSRLRLKIENYFGSKDQSSWPDLEPTPIQPPQPKGTN